MIPGFFDQSRRDGSPIPRVLAALSIPNVTTAWHTVDFLVDTGAATTCLHPLDATSRLGIAPADLAHVADSQEWQRHESYQGVGGAATYYVLPAHYAFRHDCGQVAVVRGEIRVAQLHPDNQALDSVLGWDILQHFRLVTDWSRRQVHLHPVSPPPLH